MSSLEKLISSNNFQSFFMKREGLKFSLQKNNVLSRGIKEKEIRKLLNGESLFVESNGKANGAKPFAGLNNEGLKISWNYGSDNKDYLAVILFHDFNLEVNLGHESSYINKYDNITKNHKTKENPYVCRINGEIATDNILYLMIRNGGDLQIFSHGLNTNHSLIRLASKGKNYLDNLVFGEYHFLLNNQKIEVNIIEESPNLEVIYSEVLEGEKIVSLEDVNRLIKKDKSFNPLHKHDFRMLECNSVYNTSLAFLIKWYQKYNIPIIGINHQQSNEEKLDLTNLPSNQKNSLLLVGRSHLKEVYDKLDNVNVVVPESDRYSNLPEF